jgi:hypothetical protein
LRRDLVPVKEHPLILQFVRVILFRLESLKFEFSMLHPLNIQLFKLHFEKLHDLKSQKLKVKELNDPSE